MTTMATVRVNTTQKMILYRDFTIQEVWATEGDVWEWGHNDFGSGNIGQYDRYGQCQTLFECIDAVDAWYEQEMA